jgi:hypothetical protein
MKHTRTWIALLILVAPLTASAAARDWEGFLDFAYVYSSAEPLALSTRLEGYAAHAGVELRDYLKEEIEAPVERGDTPSEADVRRSAIGYLLDYVASGSPESLDRAVEAARQLEKRVVRTENRYWIHYVRAQQALHHGRAQNFVEEIMNLWLGVIELEAPYETYRLLSLHRSPTAGFVAALPYIYENLARLILIRAPQMGTLKGLDPLGGLVIALADGRVGWDAEAVPAEVSARDYVQAVARRLQGSASDGQRLSFTLALFEANIAHDQSRGQLASTGLSAETIDAINVSVGAYSRSLELAETLQGQVAVYTQALRQLGEVYAARQRLEQSPELRIPFSIERAIELYEALHAEQEDFAKHGYREGGREAYLTSMTRLWEEIQEASHNAADYYMARGLSRPGAGEADLIESAAQHTRYLSFFHRYAGHADASTTGQSTGVPDSAYFAAHRAARGVADALMLRNAGNPTRTQLELATNHYREALTLHPFDPDLWASLASSLSRQDRGVAFLDVARPLAESVVRSAAIDAWLNREAQNTGQLATLRRTMGNDLTLMYLGFANGDRVDELQAELAALRTEHETLVTELAALEDERSAWESERAQHLAAQVDPAQQNDAAGETLAELAPDLSTKLGKVADRIALLVELEQRLDEQIRARDDAMPLFIAALDTAPLTWELGVQRDHPVHVLIRRMFREQEETIQ